MPGRSDKGYGPTKVSGIRKAPAKSIPPKGLATQSNGAPYREKKSPLPPSNSAPDYGAAKGRSTGMKKLAPKKETSKITKSPPKRGTHMREFDSSPKGNKKGKYLGRDS